MERVELRIHRQRLYDLSAALDERYDSPSVSRLDFYRFGLIDVLCEGLAGFRAIRDLARPYDVIESQNDFLIHLPFTQDELNRVLAISGFDLTLPSPPGIDDILTIALKNIGLIKIPSMGPDELEIILIGSQCLSLSEDYACYMVREVQDKESGFWMPCGPYPYLHAIEPS